MPDEHEVSYEVTLRFTADEGTPSPNPEDIADAIEKQLHTRGYPNSSARVDQLS